MINIFEKFEDWLVERDMKKYERRITLLNNLGMWIGEELYNCTDGGRILREDYDNTEDTSIIRYTITLYNREFTKKDLKIILDGDKFREPYHSLTSFQITRIFEGIQLAFNNVKHLSDINQYRINKMGIVRSDESISDGYQFQFYIELYKRFKITKSIYDKCIKTFEDSKFMFDNFNWDAVDSGASLNIPVTIRELKVDAIDEYDINLICNKISKKLDQIVNGDNSLEDSKFIVCSQSSDYFGSTIVMTISKR